MKKVLVLLSLVAAVSAFSQGTVNFQNRNANTTPQITAPISYAAIGGVRGDAADAKVNGGGAAITVNGFNYGGTLAMAGLYGGPAGMAEDQLMLLVPAVGFRSGAAAGYVNVGSSASRAFPSTGNWAVAPGANAVVQIRAWDAGVAADSFEAAAALVAGNHGVYLGKSALMTLATGGIGAPPGPAADLLALQPFSMQYIVPEPSIIGLGILGAVAGLMVFRRRE